LGIEGESLDNVMGAVDFLRKVNLGKIEKIKGRVAVIGGGNAAIDAARSALRLGVDEVNIIYRRRREDMPAHPEEISQAESEGVRMHFLTSPVRLQGNGRVCKIECLRMKLGNFDSSGRRKPMPIEGSKFTLDVDFVIRAIGQRPDTSFIKNHFEAKVSQKGTLVTNPDNLSISKNGVFAGGDLVRGPSTVIEAIRDGIKAAISIDRYLGGKGVIEEKIRKEEKIDEAIPSQENLEVKPRVKKAQNKVKGNVKGFEEVEVAYSEEEARQETSRCLRCDLEVD